METSSTDAVMTAQDTSFAADRQRAANLLLRLEGEQRFLPGVLAGVGAGIVGAVIWAVVTVVTQFQIGWMAVGVGFLVGFAIQAAGKGIAKRFGIAGAVISLLSCLLGNFLTICGFISKEEGIGVFALLTSINYAAVPEIMVSTFQPMDIVFYLIAVYEGYRFSFRRMTPQEVGSLG